ncbi:MAG: hypothetical protein QXH20_06965 [Candidatus Bathyarchaeia archaeon]
MSVEISGRNVIFLGESVSINVAANVTPVHLMIYAPNEEVVYDVWVEANSTAQFTPTEVYGLYTVKASYGNFMAETWFWLQNLKGMAVAPSQSVWVWKGITYNLSTVIEAGKISTYLLTASYEGKSFSVEWLSEVFTKLKPTEVKLESNGECWHIKTYSAKNKIDSWIMNTWFGVKIRVNGTLEKETTFKWNFKNVYGNILWQLDSFRLRADSANLIFDYSDMASRSVGCTYTLDKTNMKLDVYLQQNFDIDPTIFQDGFESGDFSNWTGTYVDTGQTLEVSTEQKHHGTYSVKTVCTDASKRAFAYKEWSTVETVYARVYVYVTQAVLSASTRSLMFLMLHDKSYPITSVGRARKLWVGIVSPNRNFLIQYSDDNNSPAGSYTSSKTLSLNTWYCIEVMHKHGDGTNGIYRVYINGELEVEWTGLDTNNFYADRLKVGMVEGWYDTNDYGTWYIDCVVVADTYIGPEGAQYIRDASQYATFSFVTARTATLQRSATQNLGTTFISQSLSMLGRVGQQLMGFTFTSQPTINSIRSAEQFIALSLSVDRFGNFMRQASETLSFTFSGLGYIPILIEVFASLALQFSTSNLNFIVNPYYASKTLVFAVGGFAFIMAVVALAFSAKKWREEKKTEEEY